MWNPPIALTPEEQKIAARTRKARKFFVFLRERRHALLAADLQHTRAKSARPEPGGNAPVAAGVVALATLWQAYCHVGDRDAGALPVMDKRWQRVLDGLGTEQPPCSQGTRGNFRLRLLAHDLDKGLLERPVALAEQTGGVGARQLRAALDSTPLCGAGRVEDPLTRLGHALRKAVGRAAQEWGTSAAAIVEDAGLDLVGQSSRNAALDLDWGERRAREKALRLGLEAGDRWQQWREPQHLSAHEPPRKAVLDTIAQVVTQHTAPDPEGGPGGRRIKQHGARDRRIAIEDQAMRPGRKSSANTFNGFQEHFVLDLDRQATREVVVRPANEPESAVVERVAEALESGPGLLQRDLALGDMASPRIAPWAAPGVSIIARPWSQGGARFTKGACPFDFAHGTVTCPNNQTVPMRPGRDAQCPATACETCPIRAQCTTARMGQGRSVTIREDEQFQQQRRAKSNTQRGRASLRKRTAIAHAISPPLAHQGRRARYKGLRKNPCDGRRPAAVSNLQVAAHYEEERRLAS